MNCLQTRREMLQNPRHCSSACLEHIQQCPHCEAEYQKLQKLELALSEAVRVPAPEGLAERLQMHGHFLAETQRRKRQTLSAIAAGILLAAVLITHQSGMMDPDALEQAVLSHINDELYHLREVHDIGLPQMNLLLSNLGGSYQDNGMQINYAGRCQIRSQQGLHMVVRGEQGPVTILVMPGEFREDMLAVDDRRFEGVIEPTPYGSFAVVGEKHENLVPIVERIRQAVSIEI